MLAAMHPFTALWQLWRSSTARRSRAPRHFIVQLAQQWGRRSFHHERYKSWEARSSRKHAEAGLLESLGPMGQEKQVAEAEATFSLSGLFQAI
jgi:hypothetical protein